MTKPFGPAYPGDLSFVKVEPSEIGLHTYVSEYTHISQFTKIGKFCSIGNLCTIGAQHHDPSSLANFPVDQVKVPLEKQTTVIGNDVWIGCNVVVLAGVKVGDGAVLGAGSVVTHDVPPYAVVAGNPALVLRYRFSYEFIARLQQATKWWDLPADVIRSLPMGDVSACLDLLSKK